MAGCIIVKNNFIQGDRVLIKPVPDVLADAVFIQFVF
jgi:hypothetical protein